MDVNYQYMIKVIGAIDNATVWNTTYHLIFTNEEIYQFLTMEGKEQRSDLIRTQISNPYRMIPLGGTVSNYKVTQEEVSWLIDENLRRGKEIEENLDSKIKEVPPKFTVIPYSSVDKVELTNGTPLSLPHLLLDSDGKKIKFHLVHNNFKGRGKLNEDIFLSYENILKEAFGDKLNVKN